MDRLLSEREVTDAIEEVDWYEICNGKLTHGASGEDTALYKAKDIYRAINGVPSIKGDRDTISRQRAIDELYEKHHGMISDESMKIYKIVEWLNSLPSAEPQERTGYWIYDGFNHTHGIEWCHCSKCGNRESVDSVYTQVDIYPYCAKCGCKMEGTDDCDR